MKGIFRRRRPRAWDGAPVGCPPIDTDVEELWARYKATGDRAARTALIDAYHGLLRHIAARLLPTAGQYTADRTHARNGHGTPYGKNGVAHAHNGISVELGLSRDDLVSYGVFGLVDAIEKFDPSRGLKFETYAMARITGAIRDELRDVDWIPKGIRARNRALAKAVSRVENRHGRTPTQAEVAAEMEITVERLERIVREQAEIQVEHLDRPWWIPGAGAAGGTALSSLAEIIADPNGDTPEAMFGVDELQGRLSAAIGALDEKSRVILALRWREQMTYAEIGKALGVNGTRACQLTTDAAAELRAALAAG